MRIEKSQQENYNNHKHTQNIEIPVKRFLKIFEKTHITWRSLFVILYLILNLEKMIEKPI